MAKNVLTYNLAEPLDDATTAKVDIDQRRPTWTIDGLPRRAGAGQRHAAVRRDPGPAYSKPWFRATNRPLHAEGNGAGQSWCVCLGPASNKATEWQIHLNPAGPDRHHSPLRRRQRQAAPGGMPRHPHLGDTGGAT